MGILWEFYGDISGWLVVQCAHLEKYERVRQWEG